jgi:hypothetical protein
MIAPAPICHWHGQCSQTFIRMDICMHHDMCFDPFCLHRGYRNTIFSVSAYVHMLQAGIRSDRSDDFKSHIDGTLVEEYKTEEYKNDCAHNEKECVKTFVFEEVPVSLVELLAPQIAESLQPSMVPFEICLRDVRR